MKRVISFCLMCCLSLPLSAQAAELTAADQLAGYLNFQSYSADFKQSLLQKNQQVQVQSWGKMALMRPSYFRWETMKPSQQIMVSNKQYLWIYDVDLMQVTQQKLSREQAFNPARLLSLSATDLAKEFTVKRIQLKGCEQAFSMHDRIAQDSPDISLCFHKKRLSKMLIKNNLGENNLFAFSNIRMNPPLKRSLFQLKIPKGVDVVKQA